MSPDVHVKAAPQAEIRESSAPERPGWGEVNIRLGELEPGKWVATVRRRWPDERGSHLSCRGGSMTAALEGLVAGLVRERRVEEVLTVSPRE
jgi:hypothetical protein